MLESLGQQTALDVLARIGRLFDKNLGKRLLLLAKVAKPGGIGVEMVGRNPPGFRVLLEDPPRSTCRAKAEAAEALRPGQRSGDRRSRLLLRIAKSYSTHRTYVRIRTGRIADRSNHQHGFQ
jgi:hypothetical protein